MIIKPYDNFDILMENMIWSKVYFENKKNFWHDTLIDCVRACRCLKTLERQYQKNKGEYNVLYKSKLLYKPTTFKFDWDSNTYTIIVNTGLSFSRGVTEIRNEVFRFTFPYDKLEELLRTMKSELPVGRANEIMMKLEEYIHN